MATDFPGYPSPGAGFEVPLEMLAACHLRVEQQTARLQRLALHVPRHGADADARVAAAGSLRYFDTAARHHQDDEEIDLFPALIESMAGSEAVCLRDMVASLTSDHRELERLWYGLRPTLERLVAGEAVALNCTAVDAFAHLYQTHIAREEAELLPMASRLLGDAELDRIGMAMRLRRGGTWPSL